MALDNIILNPMPSGWKKYVKGKGRTTSWIAELPNFEHVPHFIAELSANCSQTYILLPNQVVAMKYQIEF